MSRRLEARDLTGVNLLDICPLPAVDWEEREGRVVLLRTRPSVRRPKDVGRLLSFYLAPPRLRLDDVGSFAWRRFDGQTRVRDVVAAVREAYGETAEPAEERLGEFVRLLRRERLLWYAGYDS